MPRQLPPDQDEVRELRVKGLLKKINLIDSFAASDNFSIEKWQFQWDHGDSDFQDYEYITCLRHRNGREVHYSVGVADGKVYHEKITTKRQCSYREFLEMIVPEDTLVVS